MQVRIVRLDYPGGFSVQYWSWWPLGWRYFTDKMDYRGIVRFYDRGDAERFVRRMEDCKEDMRVGC